MEQETIAQTMLDQLVTDENSQMLKALIPYLSFSGQRILAAYAKTQELCNTLQLFSRPQNDMQIRNDAIFTECCCFRKKEWTSFFTK